MTERMNASGTVVIDDEVVATNPAAGDRFPIPNKGSLQMDGKLIAISTEVTGSVLVENRTNHTLIIYDDSGEVRTYLSPDQTAGAPGGGSVKVGA